MLKAAVIYMQGSGGNLLLRTLALNETTVPIVPKQLANDQPTLTISELERYKLYDNWNSNNWTTSENEIQLWYKTGDQQFLNYEESPKLLIDVFHPQQFKDETEKKVLWKDVKMWEHLIYIKYDPTDLDKIIKIAGLKRQDLNHKAQILTCEISAYEHLINAYPGLELHWKDMQHLETYVNSVTAITDQLGISLNLDLVTKLWESWKLKTDCLLKNE